MAIKQLTDEQIRDWTREQKDRWWLENVFRGDMPQLTFRSALTGFLLGGVLSRDQPLRRRQDRLDAGRRPHVASSSRSRCSRSSRGSARSDITILENNAMQSIATAAGYMTGPLISGIAAYMWVDQQTVIPWWQMMVVHVVLSILGVLVAFPMKRRFINDEQQPFPEGRACGVVLDTLYTARRGGGPVQGQGAGDRRRVAGGRQFISGETYMTLHPGAAGSGCKAAWHLPEQPRRLVLLAGGQGLRAVPKLATSTSGSWRSRPTLDLAMFGAGGLMGIRAATSMCSAWCSTSSSSSPWMISLGEIMPEPARSPRARRMFGRVAHRQHLGALVGHRDHGVASLVALFAKPKVFVAAFTRPARASKDAAGSDVLAHIELPLWISFVGIPIVGAIGVWMAARLVRRALAARRAGDPADLRALADRRERDRRSPASRPPVALQDHPVHVRRPRPAAPGDEPHDRASCAPRSRATPRTC